MLKLVNDFSLKTKLLAALSLLILLNCGYFYFGANSVAELNGLIETMYDNVVMTGTYSQMVKNDFFQYSAAAQSAILAPDAPTFSSAREKLTEAKTSLDDNLKVVEERTLSLEDHGSIKEMKVLIDRIEAHIQGLLDVHYKLIQQKGHVRTEEIVRMSRDWYTLEDRVLLSQMISDLADKVVADGYHFRERASERSAFIGKATSVFAAGVIAVNAACMILILLSVLPRLRRLTLACAEIAEGNYSKRVLLRSKDEFGTLAKAFNSMLSVINERESQIRQQLFTTNAMVDSLNQGFLIFDKSGQCLPVHSKACLDLLEVIPAGLPIWNVLKIEKTELEVFQSWVDILFSGAGTFEDLAKLYPLFSAHTQKRLITLEYRPLKNDSDVITHIVLVATDKTEELRAKAAADKEQAFSKMISNLLRNRTQFSRFLIEVDRMLKELTEAPPSPATQRLLHTIKGGAATFSIQGLKELAHECETDLALSPTPFKAREVSEKMRGEYERTLLELFNTCAFLIGNGEVRREVAMPKLIEFHQRLKQIPDGNDLSAKFASSFLLEPIGDFFKHYDESAQQLAARLGKRIRPIEMNGGDLHIFGESYSALFASFVHVFRNAIDHGIEAPRERVKLGKEPTGKIVIHFSREVRNSASFLKIEIGDDGRGVNVESLRLRLASRLPNLDQMSDQDVLQELFQAGTSTATVVTDVSGRGIGMDAVRANAIAMGGTAKIESVLGKGTTIVVMVPEISLANAKVA